MKKKIIIIVSTILLLAAAITAGSVYYFVILPRSDYMGKDSAREAALSDLGVTSDEVRLLDVDLEKEDGYPYYEVSFTHEQTEYEYAVDVMTCEIMNIEKESIFD